MKNRGLHGIFVEFLRELALAKPVTDGGKVTGLIKF
jgi:hypothetical protein